MSPQTPHPPVDGTPYVEGVPFAECKRCHNVVVLDPHDGLANYHRVACGKPCDLAPYGEGETPCDGWCFRCRTILTGCKGDPDAPCGAAGCPECGVHASDGGRAVCGNERRGTAVRFAWVWSRVTCKGCHHMRAFLAVRSAPEYAVSP